MNDALAHRRIKAHVRLARNVPRVLGDRVQSQQVMLNLVMNGIDATTDVTDRLRELVVSSRVHANGQVSRIVTDSGVVVDPALVERLFDPVFTTKEGGMESGCRSVDPLSKAMLASYGHRRTTDGAYRFTSLSRRSNEQ